MAVAGGGSAVTMKLPDGPAGEAAWFLFRMMFWSFLGGVMFGAGWMRILC